MTAEIFLLHHADVEVETNPQVIISSTVPDAANQIQLDRLGYSPIPDLGEFGIFTNLPAGWDE